jgi:hypothetical protein
MKEFFLNKRVIILFFLIVNSIGIYSQNNWVEKASIGGAPKTYSTSFVIGNKLYVTTGAIINSGVALGTNELWEYDPSSDTWARKADFPGTARYSAFGFSIGTKGYIGTGRDGNTSLANDFWEYNSITNAWSQKADFPGGKRMGAFGITIDNRGFAGGGVSSGVGSSLFGSFNNDLFEYLPLSNTWIQKASFGNIGRINLTTFSIGTKGYVGLGSLDNNSSCSNCSLTNDFFEFNINSNTWKKISNYPDSIGGAFGFNIDSSGYVGGGSFSQLSTKSFYEYIPSLNKWRKRAPILAERIGAIGGNVINTGFMMGGSNMTNAGSNVNNDTKKYTPCNGYIYSIVTKYICEGQTFDFNGKKLTNEGSYYDTLYSVNGCDSAITLNLKIAKNPVVTISNEKSIKFCVGDSVRLYNNEKKVDTINYQWLNGGAILNSKIDTFYFPKTTGLYSLKATSKILGCTSTSNSISILVYNLPPAPVVANKEYCKDSLVIKIDAIALSKNTLRWYKSNIISSVYDTIAPLPNTSNIGTFNFYVNQVSDTTGCNSPISSIVIKVLSPPVAPIVKDTAGCINSTPVVLNATGVQGNTILWYGTNASGGSSTLNFSAPTTLAGTFSYYVSQKNLLVGCEGPRAILKVTIKDLPAAPIISRDNSGNLVSSYLYNNQWFISGVNTGDTTRSYKPTSVGSYTVKSLQGGCLSLMSQSYYYLITDIINISKDEYIKLAPNPFINNLKLDFVIKGYQRLNIEVINLATGAKMASIQNVTSNTILNLANLSAGANLIKITSDDFKISFNFKMIKL